MQMWGLQRFCRKDIFSINKYSNSTSYILVTIKVNAVLNCVFLEMWYMPHAFPRDN